MVSLLDKVSFVLAIYKNIRLISGSKEKIVTFLKPLDATRYYEIPYMMSVIGEMLAREKMNILDCGSPHQAAMVLSNRHNVLRINLDESEKKYLIDTESLKFKKEDLTKLTFKSDSFDFVYSISVIEHIYENYMEAVREMVRVCKKSGYIYLSFPIAPEHKEVWSDSKEYAEHVQKGDKFFFEYNFNPEEIMNRIGKIENIEIVSSEFLWEKKKDSFMRMIDLIKIKWPFGFNLIKNSAVFLYYGLFLFREKPGGNFGNALVLIRKIA